MIKSTIQALLVTTVLLFSTLTQAQTWTELAKGLPTPFERNLNYQYYGSSSAIDGNYAVVGSYGYEVGKGSAIVWFFDGTNWVKQARLTASDVVNDDNFGYSVSISGSTIVIGSKGDDGSFTNTGSAYVFTKSGASWSDMTETAKLTASDAAFGDEFGFSVGISGDNIVVGALYHDSVGIDYGKAYVFSKPVSGWVNMTETAKLTASDGATGDFFGYSVSISGNSIVVGARNDNSNGSAYVFTKTGVMWIDATETAKLTALVGVNSAYFGYSVSISGDNIVVGAGGDNAAYVYSKVGANWSTMTETGKLTASVGGVTRFGESVGISGDNIIVGANRSFARKGAAYVFSKPTSGWASSTETATLTAIGGNRSDFLGVSVCISGDNILAGARGIDTRGDYSGAAYFYAKPTSGWSTMTETQKTLPPLYYTNYQDKFGTSVAIDGDYAVVGAPGDTSAYVFYFDGSNWVKKAKLKPTGVLSELFGSSVDISGDNIVVGIGNNYNSTVFGGRAYVYSKPSTGWTDTTQTAILRPATSGVQDMFGMSVAISGDVIVVGAFGMDQYQGAAYVFEKPSSGWVSMTETAKLEHWLTFPGAGVGKSVDISGDDIVVGTLTMEEVLVFTKQGAHWANMTQTTDLFLSPSLTQSFGYSVSISGNTVVVGAEGYNSNQGAAYVFTKSGPTWNNLASSQFARLTSSFPASANPYFGSAVSISGNDIVIGSYNQSNINGLKGAVEVFTKPGNAWISVSAVASLVPSTGGGSDYFGNAVGISGGKIIVGAKGNDDINLDVGAAFLFNYCAPSYANILKPNSFSVRLTQKVINRLIVNYLC